MGCGGSKAVNVATYNAKSASKVIAQLSSSTGCESSSSDSEGTQLSLTSPRPNQDHIPPHNVPESLERSVLSKSRDYSIMLASDKLPGRSPLPPVNIRQGATNSAGIAFNIPLAGSETTTSNGDNSLVRKYPPKRFNKLEDIQTLTLESYQEKHAEAALRRKKIINERVQSARSRNTKSASRAISQTASKAYYDDTQSIDGGIEDYRPESVDII